ncbi:MAG: hypothetical protein ACRD59_04190 [Candidatus Acidiferrales bacterium]
MGAIQFPLTSDNQSAPNQVSPQEAAKLPSSAAGPSNVLGQDIVTISAAFPPPRAVAAPNFVHLEAPPQSAIQSFPPHLASFTPARTTVTNVAQFPPAPQSAAQPVAVAAFPPPVDTVAAGGVASGETLTQQQELQQLNQTLLALGINPQSISLDNRLALLPTANDPPALLNLVHALSVIDPQLSAETTNDLSNPAQPAADQPQLPAQLQPQAQPEPQSNASPQNSTLSVGTGFETTPVAANQGTELTGNQVAQFQALQLAFHTANDSENPAVNSESASNDTNPPVPSLNVLA